MNVKIIHRIMILIAFVALAVLPGFGSSDYYRIVVFSDIHLPTKTRSVAKILDLEKVMAAKNGVMSDVNGWSDVSRVAVTGDLAANYSGDEERKAIRDYFSQLKKPLSVVTGNPDYFYIADPDDEAKNARGTPETRTWKLKEFSQMFELKTLSYALREGGVLLVFLSIDEVDGKYPVTISGKTREWLSGTLKANNTVPTIIFCHAPLNGTLQSEKAMGHFCIEPKKEIDVILNANKQVFMWVSGHTHTQPSNPGFAADYNLYAGRVMNIHNNDMDQLNIWTNSLYIYKDRVEVRTYNHKTGTFETKFDRKILIPVIPRQ